jgi:hypothetical protein
MTSTMSDKAGDLLQIASFISQPIQSFRYRPWRVAETREPRTNDPNIRAGRWWMSRSKVSEMPNTPRWHRMRYSDGVSPTAISNWLETAQLENALDTSKTRISRNMVASCVPEKKRETRKDRVEEKQQ